MRIFSEKTHRFIYILALCAIACALPYSLFVVNIGFITLIANWVLEFKWEEKYKIVSTRKSLWAFFLIYLSVIVSALYSSNFSLAFREIRMWIPLLFIPLVVATTQKLNRKELAFVIILFSISLSFTTFKGLYLFIRDYNLIGQNVRYLSPYLLHIRLSILINISIFCLWYISFSTYSKVNKMLRMVLFTLSIWFIVFLMILQSVTGIVILVGISLTLLLWFVIKFKRNIYKYAFLSFLLLLTVVIFSYLFFEVNNYFARNSVDFKTLPEKTANGNLYVHDTLRLQYENRNLVWINICNKELEKEWVKLSYIPINGKDLTGNNIFDTAIRYLASKGLTKDSLGLSKLDKVDVKLIEKGVSSVIYRDHKMGLYPRFYQIMWEIDMYRTFGAISGSSVVQRYIFAKATWAIIKENFFFGVGIGDAKETLFEYYKKNEPNLRPESRKSSHNQYLYTWLASGLFGLMLFLFGLFYPFIIEKSYKHFIPFSFMTILLISMFSIETFERFLGSAFIAFFYSIFIFGHNFKTNEQGK